MSFGGLARFRLARIRKLPVSCQSQTSSGQSRSCGLALRGSYAPYAHYFSVRVTAASLVQARRPIIDATALEVTFYRSAPKQPTSSVLRLSELTAL